MKFVRYLFCDNVLREFGARVLALHLARNLSRKEVAGAADISVRGLARFEAGDASLDLICFVRLCLVPGLRDRVPEWMPAPATDAVSRTRQYNGSRKLISLRRAYARERYWYIGYLMICIAGTAAFLQLGLAKPEAPLSPKVQVVPKARNKCRDERCLESAYRQRIADISDSGI